ncbi:MAG: magnesium/cobalt transporter CorA [Pirellulaceae bacterium]
MSSDSAKLEDKVKSRWGRVFDLTSPPDHDALDFDLTPRLPLDQPASVAGVRIVCVDYSRERYSFTEVSDIQDFLAHHRPEWSEVRWIHIAGSCDPTLARAFADKYELHPLAVEDVLNLDQRPKAEDFAFSKDHPGRLFIIARAVARKADHVETEQVSFFLGRKTLVSFEEKEPDLLMAVEGRIRDGSSRLRQHDVSFLLYCMLDHLVDSFFPILEEISVHLDGIETAVLENRGMNVLPDLYRFRRDLSLLRRVAWPMRELIFKLHRETHVCLSETTATYLRDVYDHLVQVQDLLETYREFADSLTQTYMSLVSNRMNDIMKTLTIVSTIFVPLTFLAGVYGMNMPIPENHKTLSYPLFWMFCATAAGSMLYMFRRRGWI